jgi:uncharacterized membrane protein required for colicin V production
MNLIDTALALLVVGSVAGGVRKGLGRSGFGLLAALAAFMAAAWLVPASAEAFLVMFVLVLCAIATGAFLLGRWFKTTSPEWLDRVLGGAFGFANALLFAVLAVTVWMTFAPRFQRDYIMRSASAPYLIGAAWNAAEYLPDELKCRAAESYEELAQRLPLQLRKDVQPLPRTEI